LLRQSALLVGRLVAGLEIDAVIARGARGRRRDWMSRTRGFALALTLACFAGPASGAPIWTESVDGDLSGNRAAPTALAAGIGSNQVSGTTVAGDLDYFSLLIPAGATLSQIVLTNTTLSSFDLAFLAIQSGSTFTVDPSNPDVSQLLGWVHLRSNQVGTDILDNLAIGSGAIGFLPPLGPGTYSFWLQQTGGAVTGYGLDFVVVPEPMAASLLALGLTGLAFAGRRRR
jgi:hypothetical protein